MENVQYVTQWFTDETPQHIGVYERDMSTAYAVDKPLIYSLWDGFQWFSSGATPEDAMYGHDRWESFYQILPWRGVVKDND